MFGRDLADGESPRPSAFPAAFESIETTEKEKEMEGEPVPVSVVTAFVVRSVAGVPQRVCDTVSFAWHSLLRLSSFPY